MRADGEYPEVGASARSLGVRPNTDIHVAPNGAVQPRTGGMSVAPNWRDLKGHRIPKRLKPLCEKATGNNTDRIWFMGEGVFENSQIDEYLELICESEIHGSIGPVHAVHIGDLQAHLAMTRHRWQVDEL